MDNNYIEFSKGKVVFLAACVGIIVASMFYIQPIESLLTVSFKVAPGTIAVIAMLTQVSYALGLLLVVPLGDAYNRYRFLQWMEVASVVGLVLAACSRNVIFFWDCISRHRSNLSRWANYHPVRCLFDAG